MQGLLPVDRRARRPSHVAVLHSASPKGLAPRFDEGSFGQDARGPNPALVFWIGYGFLKEDWVIILANSVGAALSGMVLYCKLRDMSHN